jgi:hypothetical protein
MKERVFSSPLLGKLSKVIKMALEKYLFQSSFASIASRMKLLVLLVAFATVAVTTSQGFVIEVDKERLRKFSAKKQGNLIAKHFE